SRLRLVKGEHQLHRLARRPLQLWHLDLSCWLRPHRRRRYRRRPDVSVQHTPNHERNSLNRRPRPQPNFVLVQPNPELNSGAIEDDGRGRPVVSGMHLPAQLAGLHVERVDLVAAEAAADDHRSIRARRRRDAAPRADARAPSGESGAAVFESLPIDIHLLTLLCHNLSTAQMIGYTVELYLSRCQMDASL